MRNLILIPSELEYRILDPLLVEPVSRSLDRTERCGFGLIAAAARTAQLIAEHDPQQVILAGIAGTLASECAIGSAYRFGQVACDGIGIGIGRDHQSAGDAGWNHYHDDDTGVWIADRITFATDTNRQLLSVAAASSSLEESHYRSTRHSAAVAEDMEGFAVAAACQIAGKPLEIFRGISNQAGNRDHSMWQIEAALHSVAAMLLEHLR
ncbi:futalosine hydrolase [Novipirellula aureliae]|uniref:futalosine hydrolase n=1 Tax=Novipirellula aureliae TaxID=2527966 RepID=UPI0018CCF710|nr:futalosine hydrolase [Novipirellula aureliae]